MIYIITYDLRKPDDTPEHYESLAELIGRLFEDSQRIQQSVWLIESTRSAKVISATLMASLPERTRLLVAVLDDNHKIRNAMSGTKDWLKGR